jgi:hypothetical protein
VLLVGEIPNGGKPHAEFGACLIKHRARRRSSLMPACSADPSAATPSLDLANLAALGANQTIRPAQFFEIIAACLL